MKADAWGIVEWIAYSCRRFRVDKLLIEGKASGLSWWRRSVRRLYGEDGWSASRSFSRP